MHTANIGYGGFQNFMRLNTRICRNPMKIKFFKMAILLLMSQLYMRVGTATFLKCLRRKSCSHAKRLVDITKDCLVRHQSSKPGASL